MHSDSFLGFFPTYFPGIAGLDVIARPSRDSRASGLLRGGRASSIDLDDL